MSNLEVTIYQRPDGRKLRTIITNVDSEDATYLTKHGVVVGMEELADNMYAVYGRFPDQDEEDEHIVLSNGRNCHECLKELRRDLESAREN